MSNPIIYQFARCASLILLILPFLREQNRPATDARGWGQYGSAEGVLILNAPKILVCVEGPGANATKQRIINLVERTGDLINKINGISMVRTLKLKDPIVMEFLGREETILVGQILPGEQEKPGSRMCGSNGQHIDAPGSGASGSVAYIQNSDQIMEDGGADHVPFVVDMFQGYRLQAKIRSLNDLAMVLDVMNDLKAYVDLKTLNLESDRLFPGLWTGIPDERARLDLLAKDRSNWKGHFAPMNYERQLFDVYEEQIELLEHNMLDYINNNLMKFDWANSVPWEAKLDFGFHETVGKVRAAFRNVKDDLMAVLSYEQGHLHQKFFSDYQNFAQEMINKAPLEHAIKIFAEYNHFAAFSRLYMDQLYAGLFAGHYIRDRIFGTMEDGEQKAEEGHQQDSKMMEDKCRWTVFVGISEDEKIVLLKKGDQSQPSRQDHKQSHDGDIEDADKHGATIGSSGGKKTHPQHHFD